MVKSVRATGIDAPAPIARDSTRAPAGRFTVDDGAAPVLRTAPAASMVGIGLDSMLALQAVDEDIERDRAAHRRGSAILAALSKLQRSLLGSEDQAAALHAMTELTADIPLANDPALAAILKAVVLRSRLEIARRERVEALRQAGSESG